MKVDDKILCKSDFFIYYDCYEFKSGEYYKIVEISDRSVTVKNKYCGNRTFFFIGDKPKNIRLLFYDYFYTDNEVRKMKLNKIVDTNEED